MLEALRMDGFALHYVNLRLRDNMAKIFSLKAVSVADRIDKGSFWRKPSTNLNAVKQMQWILEWCSGIIRGRSDDDTDGVNGQQGKRKCRTTIDRKRYVEADDGDDEQMK